MAKKLKSWPGRAGSQNYPWEDWLNGEVWQLEEGVDYKTSNQSMRASIQHQSKQRGFKTRTGSNETGVYLQALLEG